MQTRMLHIKPAWLHLLYEVSLLSDFKSFNNVETPKGQQPPEHNFLTQDVEEIENKIWGTCKEPSTICTRGIINTLTAMRPGRFQYALLRSMGRGSQRA